MIDQPSTTYNTLSPCPRWSFNGCNAKSDTPENCHPHNDTIQGDYTKVWQGLAVAMQCSTPDCICGYLRFDYAASLLFDTARLYCPEVQLPTVENVSSPEFFKMTQMFTEFCSDTGSILSEMILSFQGQVPQSGM